MDHHRIVNVYETHEQRDSSGKHQQTINLDKLLKQISAATQI